MAEFKKTLPVLSHFSCKTIRVVFFVFFFLRLTLPFSLLLSFLACCVLHVVGNMQQVSLDVNRSSPAKTSHGTRLSS